MAPRLSRLGGASGGASWGALRAWTYKDGKSAWAIDAAHDGWIRKLAISPDGNIVATCGVDQKIRGWNAQDGKKLWELDQKDDAFSIAFHPDGKHLVAGDLHGTIRAWELATGKPTREFDAKTMYLYERIQDVGGVRTIAFDRTGNRMACGGAGPAGGGFVESTPQILVFDWANGKLEHRWNGTNKTEGFVHELVWHADGFLMGVSSGQPGQGRFFFLQPGEAAPFFVTNKMANCHSFDLHPDGRRLAVSATNANSSGNGRVGRAGDYPANVSPLTFWEMPKT